MTQMKTDLIERLGLNLIPEPQEIEAREGVIRPSPHGRGGLCVVVAPGSADEDRFAAEYLAECLGRDVGLTASVRDAPAGGETPVRIERGEDLPEQGYRLTISPEAVTIEGADGGGVYYAAQTLRQCFRHEGDGVVAPCLTITDWPDLRYRAVHYDTKHHQDTREYVEGFIEELAHYKVNVLVWEWEDKFAYRRHPEIAAPGAFTMEEMQELTRFAGRHHVQIVPLVQGLGHVSYILKHPQHRHLREIADSNWEFCPLGDGTYELLFDLWDEAIEATPGAEFLHIGSDETYELGLGETCGCSRKAAEIGRDGLMQLFIHRCVAHVEKRGRRALSWGGRWRPDSEHVPPKSMIFVDSGDVDYLRAASFGANGAGYQVWVYAPNPGIMPLFLPFFPWVKASMWRDDPAQPRKGSFRETGETIARAASSKLVDGSITTSWDDSGLHNQCWMPRFVCAADFSWKADGRDIETWTRRFFANYFGPRARDLREVFQLLQDGAQFYYDTFQRRVWHWGDVGKIHLPDLPRGDLEFSDFWRRRYAGLLRRAREEGPRIARALAILDDNLSPAGSNDNRTEVRHRYDLEVMRSCAELMRHNVELILMLSRLEGAVSAASEARFSDRRRAGAHLEDAARLVRAHLEDREAVFDGLVAVWEKTRLPKGLALPEKPYVHARDRARHFADRTSDMRYLIVDEQLLELETWLARLKAIIADYGYALNEPAPG